jgi:regulator of nucleoside diphosphate kinase
MSTQQLFVTDVDSRRLQALIEGVRQRGGRDAPNVERLEQHLGEAAVTAATRIGPNVVTMNSTIRVADLDSGERLSFQLVFPRAADAEAGRISVLAPLGQAVLGRSVGQEIAWAVPSGLRRMRIEEVVSQPEREGRDVA